LSQRKHFLCAAEDGRRGAAGGEKGQALLESAVSLPVLFALLFCFMELCLVFYTYDTISESAREGSRYAMLLSTTCTNSSGASCTATAAQVNSYVSGLGWPNIAGGTMTVSTIYKTPAGGVGTNSVSNIVVVQVSYIFPITMPFVPKNLITLKSASQMTIIQ
jgi:Flp pilus assembly protein TadG